MLKQNFNLKDRVKFINCMELTGKTGYILGTSVTDYVVDFYMVMLDEPLETHLAINIIETCLEKL